MAPEVGLWQGITLAFGLIVTVQGFETSRYLGATYDAPTRIRSMILAQALSTLIYLAYILLLALTGLPRPDILSETAIIDMMVQVAWVLPLMLVAAVLAAQFGAAVADTSRSGTLISHLSHGRLSVRHAYRVALAMCQTAADSLRSQVNIGLIFLPISLYIKVLRKCPRANISGLSPLFLARPITHCPRRRCRRPQFFGNLFSLFWVKIQGQIKPIAFNIDPHHPKAGRPDLQIRRHFTLFIDTHDLFPKPFGFFPHKLNLAPLQAFQRVLHSRRTRSKSPPVPR